jgi:hypothetical protein
VFQNENIWEDICKDLHLEKEETVKWKDFYRGLSLRSSGFGVSKYNNSLPMVFASKPKFIFGFHQLAVKVKFPWFLTFLRFFLLDSLILER